MSIDSRRQSSEALEEIIARELPGLHFRVSSDDFTMMTVLEVQRYVENYRYPIDATLADKAGAPSAIMSHVLDVIRHRVTEDYGLTPYIERLKQEAAREAREAMARALVNFAEQYREKIPTIVQVQDEDDPEVFYEEQSWVPGNLPREVQALVERAKQLSASRRDTPS